MPSRPGALILATLLAVAAVPSGAAEFLGAYEWRRDVERHGGYSAIELGDDGLGFTVLSDRSRVVTGTFLRRAGTIVGVTVDAEDRLRNRKGRPMQGDFGDSEGLAVGAAGLFVSFESMPRVWHYATPDATPRPLPRHPDFKLLPANGALEALAQDRSGALYVLPERAIGALPFPVWRFDGNKWSVVFTLPDQGYAIVGADFDDRDRLYLLERRFGGIGFATRLRRVTLTDGAPTNDRVLLETRLRRHDNLEGLSIWRDGAGRLRATMISDDNFNWFQRTEIVEYALPD